MPTIQPHEHGWLAVNSLLVTYFGCAADVVGQWAGHTNLQHRDQSNRNTLRVESEQGILAIKLLTKEACKRHHGPVERLGDLLRSKDLRYFSKQHHNRDEQDAGIGVVVASQSPHVSIQQRQNLLNVDGIEGDTHACTNAEEDPHVGQFTTRVFLQSSVSVCHCQCHWSLFVGRT